LKRRVEKRTEEGILCIPPIPPTAEFPYGDVSGEPRPCIAANGDARTPGAPACPIQHVNKLIIHISKLDAKCGMLYRHYQL